MTILNNGNKFLCVAGFVLVGIVLCSCGDKPRTGGQATGPVPVNIQEVERQPAVYYEQYPGTVVALSQVELRAELGGYITGIFFKEGDHVRKGQKLYEIDRSKYAATYSQAQANLQVARANEDKAQKDADRYIYLNKQDAIARQVLDHAMTDLQNAKSQVASAKADMVKAQTDLKYSVITAPFDGLIGLSQVKMGTLVTAGQTLLNTVSTDDPVAVDFVIGEKQIGRFLKIQNENIPAGDSLFTLLMPDNSLYNYPGKITVVDRAVDPQTGTIKIRLSFPDPQKNLRVGMSCIVRVHSQEGAEQIVIPGKAVTEQMGEYFVFVTRDTTINDPKEPKNNGKALVAVQKKVMPGQAINDKIIIKSGIEPGEHIIVEGIQKLHDGSVVTTGPPAAAKH